ncbi:MAG: BLUF domain-containing protein [Pseudomonadota bacterium]
MKKLLQVIYISRSTFEALDANNKIEPNVARILAKSRTNNRLNGLVGVLYFGDGVFFQCLEGEEAAVNTLLTKLEADSRHKDLKVISRKYIDQLSFGDWAMKFAPLDEQIQQFLKENNYQSFDPYQFSGEIINKFLKLLFNANETIDDSAQSSSLKSVIKPEQHQAGVFKDVQLKSNLALAISMIALTVSLIAIYAAM